MYRKRSENFELKDEKYELPNGKHTSGNDINDSNININGKYEQKDKTDTQPGKTEEDKYVYQY